MYQLPPLASVPHLVHGFSTVDEGNMSFTFRSAEQISAHRRIFFEKLGADRSRTVGIQLEHKDKIIEVDTSMARAGDAQPNNVPMADGLFTRDKDLFIFFLVADCLPIIFYDRAQQIVGLVHAGWKGTEVRIAEKMAKLFLEKLGTHANDLLVGIGPGIHQESYAFKDPIQKTLPGWEPYLQDLPNGETNIDIVRYNIDQLLGAGVAQHNLAVAPINTATDTHFFSHYRAVRSGEPEGRMLAVVGIRSIS